VGNVEPKHLPGTGGCDEQNISQISFAANDKNCPKVALKSDVAADQSKKPKPKNKANKIIREILHILNSQ
jgi:hypothetical protein